MAESHGLRAPHLSGVQDCRDGMTNKANRKKFAYRIALMTARAHVPGNVASMMAPVTSIAALQVVCPSSDVSRP